MTAFPTLDEDDRDLEQIPLHLQWIESEYDRRIPRRLADLAHLIASQNLPARCFLEQIEEAGREMQQMSKEIRWWRDEQFRALSSITEEND